MRREPVLLAGVVIVALRWIAAALGWEWSSELEATTTAAVGAVIDLGIVAIPLIVARSRVMPTRTIRDAGLSPAAIQTRADDPAVPPIGER
jgi:hypothetical protein